MNDLSAVFATLRGLLKAFEPPLVPKRDEAGYFDLWSKKEVMISGRKKKEVFFAGIIIQKGYVGLYYMPIYADADLKTVFEPKLLSLLKGKSCFHIRVIDAELLRQIESALRIGFDLYRKNGWV